MSYGDDSSVAAFATIPGSSAITLIRCSGKDSIPKAASVFSAPEKLKEASGNTVIHGWIVSGGLTTSEASGQAGERIDEVLVSVFRAPKSYTGEDGLDICCHGGPVVCKAVLRALRSAGFRDALPGEFTFRAFMNGKIDLTRSESVMELVSAKTETGRRHAISRLSGALEKEINEIKKLLVQVLSGAEIYLDYSEDEVTDDDDESAGKLPGADKAREILARLQKLSSSWKIERLYQEGVTVVIAGRPNAGKSSLFNAMLKEDRSIVTEVPGTTRDWIEAWVNIEGIPVRLVDTAGLRDSADSVEKIGVERSRRMMDEAEIILYLIDGACGVTDEDRTFLKGYTTYSVPSHTGTLAKFGDRHLLVWNKVDIKPVPAPHSLLPAPCFSVSAKTGEGITELNSALVAAIQGQLKEAPEESAVALGTERQKKLVDTARAALEEALALAEKEEPLDLIAPLIREAVNALGEITGEVSTADILEEMFSRFCVGK
jgi:tRNA modification GTPase